MTLIHRFEWWTEPEVPRENLYAHQDLNQQPSCYKSTTLTTDILCILPVNQKPDLMSAVIQKKRLDKPEMLGMQEMYTVHCVHKCK